MARTTAKGVRDVLGRNYDSVNSPTLNPMIDVANLIISKLRTLAADQSVTYTTAELEMMERYVAAQRYCDQDPLYTSRSTLSASGSFQKLDNEVGDFAKTACSLDQTGILKALLLSNVAGGAWVGKTETEQLSYDDRN